MASEEEEYQPEEEMVEVFVGSVECTWWNFDVIEEAEFDSWVEKMKAKHKQECGCSAEFQFSHI
jgi:hypothetical protein